MSTNYRQRTGPRSTIPAASYQERNERLNPRSELQGSSVSREGVSALKSFTAYIHSEKNFSSISEGFKATVVRLARRRVEQVKMDYKPAYGMNKRNDKQPTKQGGYNHAKGFTERKPEVQPPALEKRNNADWPREVEKMKPQNTRQRSTLPVESFEKDELKTETDAAWAPILLQTGILDSNKSIAPSVLLYQEGNQGRQKRRKLREITEAKKQITFSMNILCLSNFSVIQERLIELAMTSTEICQQVTDVLFRQVKLSPLHLDLYARLCRALVDKVSHAQTCIDLKVSEIVYDTSDQEMLRKEISRLLAGVKAIECIERKFRMVDFLGKLINEQVVEVGTAFLLGGFLIQQFFVNREASMASLQLVECYPIAVLTLMLNIVDRYGSAAVRERRLIDCVVQAFSQDLSFLGNFDYASLTFADFMGILRYLNTSVFAVQFDRASQIMASLEQRFQRSSKSLVKA